eukprot:955138-Rhodomonas_salina.1
MAQIQLIVGHWAQSVHFLRSRRSACTCAAATWDTTSGRANNLHSVLLNSDCLLRPFRVPRQTM